jgi:predicted DNA-binding transcriptional regulator YafY
LEEEIADAADTQSVRIRLRFDAEEEAIQFALSFGGQIEAIEPPELRAKVVAGAQATVERYRTSNPAGVQ